MLISAKNLSVLREGRTVLSNVNFTIQRGEVVTFIGPNGGGKSTLLKALIGAVRPASGTITRASHLRIGYVPQLLDLNAQLPITTERFLNMPERHSAASMQKVLEELGIKECRHQQIRALSGGQLQRVLLARAILTRPDILVLDEATQGLDQPGTVEFYRRLTRLRDQLDCAILLASHDLHVVMATSDRVVCINGHICCQGAPQNVLQNTAYQSLFPQAAADALALYQHDHDHRHDSDEPADHKYSHSEHLNHGPHDHHRGKDGLPKVHS